MTTSNLEEPDRESGREFGYARFSTSQADLRRQLAVLTEHGIPGERVYRDVRTGGRDRRPGFAALLDHIRAGDTVVADTLDRLGATTRDCLALVAELHQRGVRVRTLSDPIPIHTGDDPVLVAQAEAMLLFLAQLDRVFTRERAAHARGSAAQNPSTAARSGRPVKLAGEQLAAARAAVDSGMSVTDAAAWHGVHRATLYRHLKTARGANPSRPASATPASSSGAVTGDAPGRAATDAGPGRS